MKSYLSNLFAYFLAGLMFCGYIVYIVVWYFVTPCAVAYSLFSVNVLPADVIKFFIFFFIAFQLFIANEAISRLILRFAGLFDSRFTIFANSKLPLFD